MLHDDGQTGCRAEAVLGERGRFIAAPSLCRLHVQQTQRQHCALLSSLCKTEEASLPGVLSLCL